MNRLVCLGLPILLLAAPAMAGDANRISPAPHVSLSLPSGWMACDPKTGTKLAPGVDPAKVAAFDCKSGGAEDASWLLEPDTLVVFSRIILTHDPKIGHDFYGSYAPEGVKRMQDRVCASLAAQLDETVRACGVVLKRRGNANALGGLMITSSNATPTLLLRVSFTMLAYEEWATQVVVVEGGRPSSDLKVQALFDSITVE